VEGWLEKKRFRLGIGRYVKRKAGYRTRIGTETRVKSVDEWMGLSGER
jgi:hypothetical protein